MGDALLLLCCVILLRGRRLLKQSSGCQVGGRGRVLPRRHRRAVIHWLIIRRACVQSRIVLGRIVVMMSGVPR